MGKRNFLEKMLEELKDSWELWNALLVLLRNDELDDQTIDNLIGVIEDSLNKVEDLQSRRKIQKWIDAMKRMRDREMHDKAEDALRLADLDGLIENI